MFIYQKINKSDIEIICGVLAVIPIQTCMRSHGFTSALMSTKKFFTRGLFVTLNRALQ